MGDTSESEKPSDITILDVFHVLSARARVILAASMGASVIAAVLSLFIHNAYTSRTTFMPESRESSAIPGNLLGLASQFGFNLGSLGGEANESPLFYANLTRSREVSTQVLMRWFPDYETEVTADSLRLIDLLEIKDDKEEVRVEKGLADLESRVRVTTNAATGVISLSAETRWPGLSRDIMRAYLETINDFNTRRRNSTARLQREFVERRVDDAYGELQAREDALQSFHLRNRVIQDSPELLAKERALERQVTVSQEVYLALRRELETARIAEVNDTPVITVIDSPSLPGRKSSPHRKLITISAGLFAAVLVAVGVLFSHFMARASAEA